MRHRIRQHRYRQPGASRCGFTLLELMLALALTVVATLLIGSLLQLYARNFAARGEDIRREQLARSILTMIADDIRSVVTEQEYDEKALQQLLGASGGGSSGGGDGSADGGSDEESGAGYAANETSTGYGGDMSASSMSGVSDAGTPDYSTMITSSLPPGLYGSQSQLMVDVSRVPRTDEYFGDQTTMMDATLADVPGDMKMVTYYVQSPTMTGVQDAMNVFQGSDEQVTQAPSGLVRRKVDRHVADYAQQMGDTQRLMRTGDLLAPEVVSLEFMYFDGMQWLASWDSSIQGLPWLVQITLAMQSSTGGEMAEMPSGTDINMLSLDQRQNLGIEIYELTVAIPGAQFHTADAQMQSQSSGMESMGL